MKEFAPLSCDYKSWLATLKQSFHAAQKSACLLTSEQSNVQLQDEASPDDEDTPA